jgi:hypothetical protein
MDAPCRSLTRKLYTGSRKTALECLIRRPRVVFAWLCDGSGLDGGASFSQAATRFRFE